MTPFAHGDYRSVLKHFIEKGKPMSIRYAAPQPPPLPKPPPPPRSTARAQFLRYPRACRVPSIRGCSIFHRGRKPRLWRLTITAGRCLPPSLSHQGAAASSTPRDWDRRLIGERLPRHGRPSRHVLRVSWPGTVWTAPWCGTARPSATRRAPLPPPAGSLRGRQVVMNEVVVDRGTSAHLTNLGRPAAHSSGRVGGGSLAGIRPLCWPSRQSKCAEPALVLSPSLVIEALGCSPPPLSKGPHGGAPRVLRGRRVLHDGPGGRLHHLHPHRCPPPIPPSRPHRGRRMRKEGSLGRPPSARPHPIVEYWGDFGVSPQTPRDPKHSASLPPQNDSITRPRPKSFHDPNTSTFCRAFPSLPVTIPNPLDVL